MKKALDDQSRTGTAVSRMLGGAIGLRGVEELLGGNGGMWFSYLFVLLFMYVVVGSITHADMLMQRPVKLPLMNAELPLETFFFFAPILFVLVHAWTLSYFTLLAEKARRFNDRLEISDGLKNATEIRKLMRQTTDIFAQVLAGPEDIRESLFGLFLRSLVFIGLVLAPVLLLLLLHMQFLPYHDSRVTWLHRGVLIFDLVIIWWLWTKILSGRSRSDAGERTVASRWQRFLTRFLWWLRNIVAWPLTGLIVAFSVLVATFPGEWRQWPYSLVPALEPSATSATQAIFGKVDALNKNEKDRITGSWPTNTLRLKEFDIYEAVKVEDHEKFDKKPHSYILHGRHLEGADLRSAQLGRVDLRNASLEGAWLDSARLQGASLDSAQLQG
ncbi:pentapeptide repeat-containing protein, partial [Methylocystis sp. SB2]|uniref:pentapeptide repeat-containing protein n=1 Tax=Methylocystis sp. (strain SB2) TaxID=743836 RepID=UPI001930F22F